MYLVLNGILIWTVVAWGDKALGGMKDVSQTLKKGNHSVIQKYVVQVTPDYGSPAHPAVSHSCQLRQVWSGFVCLLLLWLLLLLFP